MGRAGTATCRRAVCCDAAMRRLRRLVRSPCSLLVAARRAGRRAGGRHAQAGSLYAGRARRAATCSAASGCSGSTRRTRAPAALHAQRSRAGWTPASVPNAWNTGDDSPRVDGAAAIGWYRKDFKLPERARRAATGWSASSRSTTARACGSTAGRSGPTRAPTSRSRCASRGAQARAASTGSWCAWTRRRPTDFPPSGVTTTACRPAAGGTTAGSCARSTCARSTPSTASTVRVRPTLRVPRLRRGRRACAPPAQRDERDAAGPRDRAASAAGGCDLGSATVGPARGRDVRRRASAVRKPQLWSPGDAEPLPRLAAAARAAGAPSRATSSRPASARSRVVRRAPLLNGSRSTCAASASTRTPEQGFAVDNAVPRPADRPRPRRSAPTIMRTHYPPHPYLHELADRAGDADLVRDPRLRDQDRRTWRSGRCASRRAKELRKNIETNQNHPSVLLWSIANELSAQPGARAGLLHPARRAPRQAARPDAPGRHRRRRLPVGRAASRVRAARRHRRQRVLRLVPGPQRPDRSTARSSPATSTPSARATRTRRSWSRSSARRPTARGRSRRRAPGPSSRTSSTSTSACSRPSRGSAARSTGRSTSSACGPAGRAATRARSRPSTRRA